MTEAGIALKLSPFRVSTALGNPGNTGNLLEFNWSWNFVTDGMTTKHPIIKISSIPVVWKKVVMMITFTW